MRLILLEFKKSNEEEEFQIVPAIAQDDPDESLEHINNDMECDLDNSIDNTHEKEKKDAQFRIKAANRKGKKSGGFQSMGKIDMLIELDWKLF